MEKYKEAINILETYNQNHIITVLESLEENKKQKLVEQILRIDFDQIMALYENTKKEKEIKEKNIEAIKYLDKYKISNNLKEEFDFEGIKVVKNGEYAVVTMAGGQGTRLRSYWSKRNF